MLRNRFVVILLPIALVAVAAVGWFIWRPGGDSTPASSTATVTSQTVKETVSADGTVAASDTASEDFAVTGTITAVYVAAGDSVRKGQILATVDDTALRATLRAAKASLAAAYTQLDDDQDDDAADVQIAADQAAIVSAKATVSDAEQAVADATLRASIAGTITDVTVEKGDQAGSGSSTTATGSTGTTSTTTSSTTTSSSAFTITSTHTFVVDATVAADDIKSVKDGLQAEITVTGVDHTVYGTVAEVGLVAQTNSSGAAVFPVTIEVTGKQKDLYAGTSATVSIITKQRTGVLTVSSRALTTEDDKTYVTKVVDGEQVKTEVTTGQTYGMTTEITKGLAEGDTVVVTGFTAPSGGSGSGQQGEFPGGGQMPDMGQMPNPGSGGFGAGQ